jgi:hypothetical protein
MKPLKNVITVILLGLLLVAFAAVSAQTSSQGDQKKKSESCCAMESCCTGESCEMKKDGEANAEGKTSCCSDMKNHDAKMKHDGKGECCKAKHKNKAKKVA